MKKGERAAPEMATRYVAATGAPFSDESAEVIGRELAKIAEANRVDDIRSLDRKLVFSIVEQDANHPLRQFYNWDDESAARAQRVAHTGLLIRSVRIVTISLGKRGKPMPMFLYVPDYEKRAGTTKQRGHVLTEDALADDPAYASAVAYQIRAIMHAVARLEHVVTSRRSPRNVVELCAGLRTAITDYKASLVSEQAAE